jgi:hypothetical protein
MGGSEPDDLDLRAFDETMGNVTDSSVLFAQSSPSSSSS